LAGPDRRKTVIAVVVGLCLLALIVILPRHKKAAPAGAASDVAAARERMRLPRDHRDAPMADDPEEVSPADASPTPDFKPHSDCREETRDAVGRVVSISEDPGCQGHVTRCVHYIYDRAGNRRVTLEDPNCDGGVARCTVNEFDERGTQIRSEVRLGGCRGEPEREPACSRPQYDERGRLIQTQLYGCDSGVGPWSATWAYGSSDGEAYQRVQMPGQPDRCAIVLTDKDKNPIGNFTDSECSGQIDSCGVVQQVDPQHSRTDYLAGSACLDRLNQLRAPQ